MLIAVNPVSVRGAHHYLLTRTGILLRSSKPSVRQSVLIGDHVQLAAGDSGVLAIAKDKALCWLTGTYHARLDDDGSTDPVGDGANYYITSAGGLFVKGRAHRGQYRDGRQARSRRQGGALEQDPVRGKGHGDGASHSLALLADDTLVACGAVVIPNRS